MELDIKTVPIKQIYKNLGLEDKGKMQQYTDKIISEALMPYVSFRNGVQEQSIKLDTVLGSGQVIIGVPYAEYQAYSKKITKKVGKRGSQPWERMCADKKDSLLREISNYGRKLDG